jgi:hypothetical protein
MDVSKEQKTLKVFSIISLVFGILALVLGALMLFGSGMALGNVDQITSEAGVTTDELAEVSGVFIVAGLVSLFSGITNILDWVFLKRVAADATKYKPAWIVTLVSLILSAASCVSSLFGGGSGQSIGSAIASLAINGYIFYLVNKVKQSVTA